MARKFYKTTFRLHVLSEDTPVNNLELEAVNEAITTGDCVGIFEEYSVVALTPKQVVKHLYEMGSEPGFFRLKDNGKDVGEDLP